MDACKLDKNVFVCPQRDFTTAKVTKMKEHLIGDCTNSVEYALMFDEDAVGRAPHKTGKKKKVNADEIADSTDDENEPSTSKRKRSEEPEDRVKIKRKRIILSDSEEEIPTVKGRQKKGRRSDEGSSRKGKGRQL
ncbi:hypothetical protein HYPSUDRAFT_34244 [Hypholoma sublateritium FD-334 SS-4]|uniref:Uncharacterized protein n=1 Tax=Hypholoma sublateritium (strain FD-334 SS-4) TaxID=945553 RepID=A0A0D2Q8D8_HYPSF|nr:hypothetical protein HYPSUDRAFT_34244 [Hypholoma sublateritium FD-334 SS-4]